MGIYSGPDISESGLVLAIDGGNFKSFKGEPTTNLIPSPTVNAYPTTGNGWGTYNTNQYNNAQYFSIGTISSVSNNIITTSTNHPLRTYDVVTPQTTGGGVSAGVLYFVKKVSDTSFTLHQYNVSQDGSQGYINPVTGNHKVYDIIATDTRISVNSTDFPTMWWGPPHVPNSGLVKELRYGEFDAIPGQSPSDCIRLHYIRTDGVMDGMAYGVDCSVTAGSPVTVSFYTRAANANAVGKSIQYQIYNYTGGSGAGYYYNFTLGQVGVWERQTYTYTPVYTGMVSYWFNNGGTGTYAWDWSCMQVEQKSYATSFIAGTRGATVATGGGWKDITGNSNDGQLINGVRESDGALLFDGVDDYVVTPNTSLVHRTSNWTYSAWVNFSALPSAGTIFENGSWTSCLLIRYEGIGITIYSMGAYWQFFPFIPTLGVWYKLDFVRRGDYIYFYVNGATPPQSLSFTADIQPSSNLFIGSSQHVGGQCFNGKIAQVQIYNRALLDTEIQQNFNGHRSRFGI